MIPGPQPTAADREPRHPTKEELMSTFTLAPTLVRTHPVVRELVLVAGGVALMGLLAQVVVPLPFTPVPLTGQTFGALLLGGAYGMVRAGASMTAYLLVGALGAPVFAGASSGISFASPTAGYLVGMLLAAALVGWAADRRWDRRLGSSLVAMLAGSVVVYAVGATWLGFALDTDAATAFELGVSPFLVGDALKLALAAALLPACWKALRAFDASARG
jgi:biotin transport system substrate-specific component